NAAITSREGAYVASTGSRVLGSARRETTRRPPGRPISPESASRSSFGAPNWGTAIMVGAAPQATTRSKLKSGQLCIEPALKFRMRRSFRVLLPLVRVGPFLQRARQAEIAQKERHHCHGGQVHPPVRHQHAVLLEIGQEVPPTRLGLRHAESQERQSHLCQYVLRDENRRLR